MKIAINAIFALAALLPLSANARQLICDLDAQFAQEYYPPTFSINVGEEMSGILRLFGHRVYFHVNSEGGHGYVIVSTSYPWTKPGARYVCSIAE